jgi:hypothetical protein
LCWHSLRVWWATINWPTTLVRVIKYSWKKIHMHANYTQADFIIDKPTLTMRMTWVQIARSLGSTIGRRYFCSTIAFRRCF